MPLLPEVPLPLPPRGFLQRRALANAHAAVQRDRRRAAEREEAAAVQAGASPAPGEEPSPGKAVRAS